MKTSQVWYACMLLSSIITDGCRRSRDQPIDCASSFLGGLVLIPTIRYEVKFSRKEIEKNIISSLDQISETSTPMYLTNARLLELSGLHCATSFLPFESNKAPAATRTHASKLNNNNNIMATLWFTEKELTLWSPFRRCPPAGALLSSSISSLELTNRSTGGDHRLLVS